MRLQQKSYKNMKQQPKVEIRVSNLLSIVLLALFAMLSSAQANSVDENDLNESDNFMVRYAPYPCIAKAILTNFGNADIVALGNSAMKRAINTGQFQARLGKNIAILDISKNHRGAELNFKILSEYLEKHTPKLVILELNQGAGERRYHPETYRLLKTDELSDLVLHDTALGDETARKEKLKSMLSKRVSELQDLKAADKLLTIKDIESLEFEDKDCTPKREKYKENELAATIEVLTPGFWNKQMSWEFDTAEGALDLADRYNLALAKLLHTKNIPGVFVHVVRMGQGPLSDSFVTKLEERYGLPVYTPSPELIERIFNNRGFRDPTHMALPGSALYADFIISRMESDGLLETLK